MSKKEKISKEWIEVKGGSIVDWTKGKLGDSLEGRLISIAELTGKMGKKGKYKLYKIETSNGDVVGTTGKSLEMKMEGLKIGTQVRILYNGIKKTSKGFNTKTFSVFTR